ncbi:MAG: hypothetical protein ACI4CA_06310 [Bacteroides sp.]
MKLTIETIQHTLTGVYTNLYCNKYNSVLRRHFRCPFVCCGK